MTDRPVSKSSDADGQQESATVESSSKTPVPFPRGLSASGWPVYAAVAIALIAAVLAALAYFHPAHTSAAVAQQGGDAKTNVCSAYKAAHKSVVINTHVQSPNPDVQLAIAANARLALIGGGSYLRERLAANTAAPTDLANAANSFADTIQQLGINYMTDAGAAVQDPLRHDLDSQISQLDKLCA
jgi:hypothetical protein